MCVIFCCILFFCSCAFSANVWPLLAAMPLSRNLFKLNFECNALFVFVVSIFEMNLENEFSWSAAEREWVHRHREREKKMNANETSAERKSLSDLSPECLTPQMNFTLPVHTNGWCGCKRNGKTIRCNSVKHSSVKHTIRYSVLLWNFVNKFSSKCGPGQASGGTSKKFCLLPFGFEWR